jgi:isoleucyl-tRNA synthetase
MSTPTNPDSAAAKNASQDEGGKSRYRSTLNLPQTSFPMKANLVQNEPASIKRWTQSKVYGRLRQARKGSPRFVFHDGPPYANGSIHLGHLMNKCLKDFVVRSRGMMGFDVPYTPGWDCHGLPIEHKVMTELVEGGKVEKLKTLDEWTRRSAVRRECQKHAEKYIKLQAGQMQRLLTIADYDDPYMTMAPAFEGATLEVLATLLERGLVYRALKPVHWSIANETALAEAELEYYDREDLSVYVDFEAADAEAVYDAFGLPAHADDEEDDQVAEGEEASKLPKPGVRPNQRPCFMIWTTTPWTLPANMGISINPKFEYSLTWIDGNVTVLASEAVERVTKAAKSEQVVELARAKGEALLGLTYRHPFVDPARHEGVGAMNATQGIEIPANAKVFCVLGADYVTLEDGTGLVHTAPGHGQEDYMTGLRENVPVYCPVKADGTYDATVPAWLRGKNIWEANGMVAEHLRQSGHLFHDFKFMHSYPHDWRSKTPTIFRCTEQWFVGVERPFSVAGEPAQSLRQRGLDTTREGVTFVPEWGRNRLRGMLESRPDWCISRQRAWGLPIPAFETADGETFMTAASVRAIVAVVRQKGSDAWFQLSPADLLAGYDPQRDPDLSPTLKEKFKQAAPFATLKRGGDILDVWFESGSSWNSVMRERGQGYPCDLYLEGSDQHRGWFQLSLLPALGVTGMPPFRTLLTHGFMVDRDGRKLSKSRPDAQRYEVDNLCTEFGMDVMRWWVSSLAYENDVKVDLELFGLAGESYRKVRNTLRFLLSNLSDFTPTCDGAKGDCVDLKSLSPTSLEAWVLAAYDAMAAQVIKGYETYDFKTVNKAIFDFCNTTLSAEYLVAVKDRLYCDAPSSPRRRATQTVLFELTDGLCRLLAPIMAHTADEAYRALWKATDADRCVHTAEFIRSSGVAASDRWSKVMAMRDTAKLSLEQAKAQMGVENPLDAGLVLPNPDGLFTGFDPVDVADLLGVSEVTFDAATSQPKVIDLRDRPRCERSWKRDRTVRQRSDGGVLSDRDAVAVGVQ